MSFLNNFSIVNELNTQLSQKIKLIYIPFVHKVLFVTDNDNVYSYFSLNSKVHSTSCLEYLKELSDRKVIKFSASYSNYFALTESGFVYNWGDNKYGQLVREDIHDFEKPKLMLSLSDYNIKDICCGFYHTIALTRDGQVITFVRNTFGQIGNNNVEQQSFIHVFTNESFGNTKVDYISSGYDHSAAINEYGTAFLWGDNSFGQVNCAESANGLYQRPISLDIGKVTKIVCGRFNTICLSIDGCVFISGALEKESIRLEKFHKVNFVLKLIDICASPYFNLSFALSENNKCFLLKYNEDNKIVILQNCNSQSLDEAFIEISNIQMTLRSINLMEDKEFTNPELLNSMASGSKNVAEIGLMDYFQAFYERFNRGDLPKRNDLVEASAKMLDLINIIKIKNNYINEMKIEFESKHFLTEFELNSISTRKLRRIVHSFEITKKSLNPVIISDLFELINNELTSGYEQISKENEKKRDEFLSNLIENCKNFYVINMKQSLRSNFFTLVLFDELSVTVKSLTQKMFTESCGKEIDSTLDPYLKKILDINEEQELVFKTENDRIFSEAFVSNTEAVNTSFEFYSTQMSLSLNVNYFFNETMFAKNEQNIRDETITLFNERCSYGDENFIKQFSDQLYNLMDEAFLQFFDLNKTKVENLVTNTKLCLIDSIKFYTENISNIESISSTSELENKHQEFSEKAVLMLLKFNVSSNSNFIIPYKEELIEEIERIYKETENQYYEKMNNNFKLFCENNVCETFDLCVNDIKILFNEKVLNENDELLNIKSKVLNEVKERYESAPKNKNDADIQNYIFERITNEIDLLLMNKLMTLYINNMNIQLEGELYFSRRELHNIYIENKLKVINLFNENIKAKDVNFIKDLNKLLKTNLECIYKNLYDENEKRRDDVINDAIVKCKNHFCDSMKVKLNDANNYLSFDELSEHVKHDQLKYFNEICGKERELYKQYYDNFSEVIANEAIKFRLEHRENVLESKTTNLDAVFKALMFYNNEMTSLLRKRICTSIDLFEENENGFRNETLKLFKEYCDKYGAQEFSDRIEKNLNESKNQFKSEFQSELKQLTVSTAKALSDSANNYIENIKTVVDLMPNHKEFLEKHEIFKTKSFEIFKEKCTVNNQDYIDSHNSKLDLRINKTFEENKNILSIKIQEFCDKIANALYNDYLTQINELMDENNGGLLDNDQLNDYHEQINSKLIIELQEKLTKFVTKEELEKYEKHLLNRTVEEFNRITKNNSALIEIKIRSLQIEIREHLNEYKNNMQSVDNNCLTDEDFLNLHISYKTKVLEQFSECNPFRNPENIEEYLTSLESEIESVFEELQLITSKHNDLFTKIITEATESYRREMEKYFRESPKNLTVNTLNDYNITITNQIVEKYQPQVTHVPNDQFREVVTSKLKTLYEFYVNKIQTKETVIGIDLGTKYVCMAYYKPGSIEIIPSNFPKNNKTPFVLFYDENEVEIIGELSNNASNITSFNTIYSTKRLIGREFSEPAVHKFIKLLPFNVIYSSNSNNDVNSRKLMIQSCIDNKALYPEQITAKILKHVKKKAENHLRTAVNSAVITVPAYFTDSQKIATKHAAMMAGFNGVRLINDSTATAIAYKLNRKDNEELRFLLIYSFGAGFLDVAIIALHKDSIEVKAISGDDLGGDDIDHNIVQYCLDKFLSTYPKIKFLNDSVEGIQAIRRLTEMCETNKCLVLGNNSADIIINNFYDGFDLNVKLTKEKFERINQELFDKSIELVKNILTDAQVTANDIDDVILVGGSTKIPKIRQMLMQLFSNKQLNTQLSEYAAAIGSAYYAAEISGSIMDSSISGITLLNIAPISICVAQSSGISIPIIRRHTKLPHRKTIPVTTSEDNQTNISVKVYEGEDIRAINNKLLGTFNILGIPSAPIGNQLVDIIFEITSEGILHAKAKLSSNAIDLEVIENKGRLTIDEIKFISQQI